jgi:hypothetical protein
MKPTLPNFLAALLSKITSFKNLSCLVVVLLFSGGAWGQVTQTFSYTGAMQTFTVPNGVTSITITATGAAGGGTSGGAGGKGAAITGTFSAIPGHILNIIVGQLPTTAGSYGGGGGGGTYVWNSTASTLLIVGGGGGGGSYNAIAGKNASVTTTPTATASGGGASGTGTLGGSAISSEGGGGAGWTGNGANASTGANGGLAPPTSTGGAKKSSGTIGGFGGGGGGSYNGGGGGGGYAGGGGGKVSVGGGGGSSYNTGTSPSTSATNTGAGSVAITYTLPVCTAPTSLAATASSSSQTTTSISGSFTAATTAPSGYLVVRTTTNSQPTLVNGTTYTVGSNAIGYIEYVNTAAGSWTSTGLSAGTPYYYYVFSYNNTSCSGGPAYSTSATTFSQSTVSCPGTSLDGLSYSSTPVSYCLSSIITSNTATLATTVGNVTYSVSPALPSGLSISSSTGAITGTPTAAVAAADYTVTANNGCTSTTAIVNIATLALPATPTSSAATSLGLTSFTANWATASGATSYILDVSTSSTFASFMTGFNGLNVSNVLTYSVTGLTSGTIYYYRVRSTNGTCTSSSSSSTITAATVFGVPFVESFGATLPSGWTTSWGSGTGSYNWAPTTADGSYGVSGPSATGGTHFLFEYVYYSSISYNTYNVTTPAIQLSTGSILSYQYFFGSGGSTTPLVVQISTNGGTSFTNLYSHTSANSTFSSTNAIAGWTNNSIDLSAYSGNILIRFAGTSNYGEGICNMAIDEVKILSPSPCAVPSSPTALAQETTGPGSIAESFTPNASLPDSYMVVRYPAGSTVTGPTNGTTTYAVGQTLGAGTISNIVSGSSSTFTLSGLSPATSYDIYVYPYTINNCTGGPVFGTALSGTHSTSACPAIPSTITVGATGDYSTLTALALILNGCAITNPVLVELQSNYNSSAETFPITIPAISGASATNTLTIKPASGVTATISGSAASSALIKIASKYVIIDGSNTAGGTTRNLTITNTSATTPSVILIGNSGTSTGTALTDVTLKNAILINGANTSNAVIVANNLTTAGYFNNITIQNNSIQKAYIGIYALATAATGNGSGLLITGNDLNTSGANAISYSGIFVQGVDGATVSNNNIANITSSTVSPNGVVFNTGTNSGSIYGNTISALSYTGTYDNAPSGIVSTATTATNISIYNNIISNISSSATGSTYNPIPSGIYISSINTSAYNNKIFNIKQTNSGGEPAFGINLSSASTTSGISVYNNFIFDIAGYGYSGLSFYNGYGIGLLSGGGYNLYNNTINMNTNQTTGVSSAIYIYSSLVTAASVNIQNNIFANTQTGGASGANRYAIYCAAANTIFGTINHNNYYSAATNLGYLGSARTNVAGIVTGFGGNANSISAIPTFTSATDLHLTTSGNCSLNNAGTPISGITTDYDGENRSTTVPDIGADEFTGDINTAGAASSTPTLCNNTILTNITHATTVATGIGTATGLPTGVTAAWASNTITISGTPSAAGTFNYTIPLSGGTCTVNATGTITINPSPTALVLTGSLACAGTTGSITSSTSVSGVDYQLYDSANAAVGSVQAGTGSGLTWSSIAIGTGYYAKATNSTTSCVSSNSNNVAVGTITDKTWIGGTSTSWNTASNWSCGTLPSASDVIIISSGSPVLDTNFTVGSGGSLTISGTSTTFTISPTSTLTVTGTANFGGKAVTIKSNSSGNGAIGQVTGTNLTGATNVTVERYIPAKRSWRAITAPVTMTTSINANWQEGGTGNSINGFDIWSTSGGTGIINGGTGSSLLAYDSTTNNTWSAITNTTTASSMMDGSKNKPFMAFVTGPYGTNNVTAGATETTLRATGTLLTGDKTYATVANKYTFIGNPYASPLDLTVVLNNTSNATTSFGGNVWVWDANVLGTYSVGTYNLFDFAASNYSYTSSNANISGAQIQSGQAFFVKSTNGANFSIKETHKGSVFTNAVFRSGAPEILRVNLYKQVNNEWAGRDGAMTVILADANANQTPNKMANGTENIAFTKNGANFASNHHLPLVATDVLNVKVWNTTAGANYKLKLNTEQFATTNLSATLEDLFTNARTPLTLDGSAVEYPFSVTTDALSTGDRFRIVFQTSTLGTTIPKATGFSIVPNPVTGDSFQVNLGTLATGSYSYSICNAIGQEVEKGSINNAAQNTNYTVKFRETAATGIYIMKIKGSDNSVFTAKLIKK